MAKTKIGPPKNQLDFSSNWKKMQATLQPSKKRKAEGSGQEAKRRKADVKPAPPAEKNEIWFEDVDPMLLERPATSEKQGDNSSLVMDNPVTHVTKALAMDCEMVGVGKDGEESVLARVSLVNQHGHPIYDKFVKSREKVTDYRTHVSGVRPHNLRQGEDFLVVQKEVSDLLKDRLLVGHALHNDLKVLFLAHPRSQMRDTSRYKPFRQLFGGRNPALKKLTAKLLGVAVQQGEHSSVQDAQAAMRLYMMHRRRWEKDVAAKHKSSKKKKTAASKKDKTTKKSESTKTVTFADVDE